MLWTRWERVSLIATAAVFGVLTWDAQAIAQSPGFAAVAVNGQGAWGASLGKPTARAAGADAVSRCGGNCRVVMTGRGQCVAFADSCEGRILVWPFLWQQSPSRSENLHGWLFFRCAGRHVPPQAF